MLDTFDNMLKIIKSNGGTAIVRFAYDDFKGTKNLILNHIKQLAPIFAKNQDAITYIELGFFGPWGEMHSSDICTTNNVNNAIDAMLENTPEKIKIGVRQPTILLEKGDKKYEIKTNIVRINNKIINLKKDNTTVNGKLPQTGEELRIMVSLIILFSILATYFYIKSIL